LGRTLLILIDSAEFVKPAIVSVASFGNERSFAVGVS